MNILIALGGNAIVRESEKGTFEEQQSNITNTARHITKIIKAGHNVVITHGNGPQVGDILLRYENAKQQLPVMPLHVCGVESQGLIGYMMEQAMTNELSRAGIRKSVACVLTQTLVSKDDPHFKNPSKPIGPFYKKREADKLAKEFGWALIREGNKYRRVVPSPMPLEILELDTIRKLMADGKVVICAGGGGVPVVKERATLRGVDAVIDKDLASSLLAKMLKVDLFLILTEVDHVFLNYRKKNQKKLTKIKVDECKAYLAANRFEEGSMKPKIEAAIKFVESTHKKAVITALENADRAIGGASGTTIVP
jgi:carbamate kinase